MRCLCTVMTIRFSVIRFRACLCIEIWFVRMRKWTNFHCVCVVSHSVDFHFWTSHKHFWFDKTTFWLHRFFECMKRWKLPSTKTNSEKGKSECAIDRTHSFIVDRKKNRKFWFVGIEWFSPSFFCVHHKLSQSVFAVRSCFSIRQKKRRFKCTWCDKNQMVAKKNEIENIFNYFCFLWFAAICCAYSWNKIYQLFRPLIFWSFIDRNANEERENLKPFF